jgi:hypothetical protein
MAYAIIGGLFVATLLTLLFLPALYSSLVPHQRAGKGATGGSPRAGTCCRPLTKDGGHEQ